jgi:hypothetical protein
VVTGVALISRWRGGGCPTCLEQSPSGIRTLFGAFTTAEIIWGVIMTMDISYAMLLLLWLAIVAFIVYGAWLLVGNRGR